MKKTTWYQFYKVNQCLLTSYLEAKAGRLVFPRFSGLPSLKNYYYLDGHTYFDENDLRKIWKILEKKPEFWAKKLVSKGVKESDKFPKFAKHLAQSTAAKYSIRDFLKGYLNFCHYFEDLLGLAGLPLIFEPVLEKELEKQIKTIQRKKEINKNQVLTQLSLYHGLTFAKQEEIAILKLATKYYKNSKSKNFQIDFKKYLDKWSWLKAHLLLNPEPMSKIMLLQRIKKAWRENPKILLKDFRNSLQRDKREFEKIIKKYSSLKNIAYSMQKVMGFRDYRYGCATQGCFLAQKFLNSFAKSLKIKYQDLIHLTPDESKRFVEKSDHQLLKKSRSRQKIYSYLFKDGKEFIFSGSKVKKEINKLLSIGKGLKVIRGLAAQTGLVKGKVRVVHNYRELKKLKKGEILVTEQTTPSFVVALKKAVGLVTDLGGLTCHAAIVSRELGIPCIVGTKVATQVLKDGDKVEVDATQGIVKKIQIFNKFYAAEKKIDSLRRSL